MLLEPRDLPLLISSKLGPGTSHSASPSLPVTLPCARPSSHVFPALPKFVVLRQEVAHLAVLSSLEDLFQQILPAEAISIQNAAPKKELSPSEHLLTHNKETVGETLSTSALNLRTVQWALRACPGTQAFLWWFWGRGAAVPESLSEVWLSLSPMQACKSEGSLTIPAFAPCRPDQLKCPFTEPWGQKGVFLLRGPQPPLPLTHLSVTLMSRSQGTGAP